MISGASSRDRVFARPIRTPAGNLLGIAQAADGESETGYRLDRRQCRYVHDAADATGPHVGHGSPDAPDYAHQVPVHGTAPGVVVEFREGTQRRCAVVVDQDVEAAEMRDRPADDPLAVFGPADVALYGEEIAARGSRYVIAGGAERRFAPG